MECLEYIANSALGVLGLESASQVLASEELLGSGAPEDLNPAALAGAADPEAPLYIGELNQLIMITQEEQETTIQERARNSGIGKVELVQRALERAEESPESSEEDILKREGLVRIGVLISELNGSGADELNNNGDKEVSLEVPIPSEIRKKIQEALDQKKVSLIELRLNIGANLEGWTMMEFICDRIKDGDESKLPVKVLFRRNF